MMIARADRDADPTRPDELVGKAASLFKLLRTNAAATDSARRLHDENIRALRESGLLSLSRPKRFGGYEVSFRTNFDVIAEIGRACASTAWVAALVNFGNWLAALMPEQAQQQLFSDPDYSSAGAAAPSNQVRRVTGGYIVSGSWGFASGCLHAKWGGCMILMTNEEGAFQGPGIAMFPMSDAEIRDTWYTAGMRGTGSNTIVLTEKFVPDHLILPIGPALQGVYPAHPENGLYRSDFSSVLIMVLVPPFLGLARAALDEFYQKAPKRSIGFTTYTRQSEAPISHLQAAEASMLTDSAHFHAYRAADDIDAAAATGIHPNAMQRARIRMDCAQAARYAQQAVNLLMTASGAGGMAESNPMQRIWRDVNTAAAHAGMAYNTNLELYGRQLFGLPSMSEM